MAGIKYAPRPYDETVTVLERVECFSHWFYTTHQKKGVVAIKLGVDIKKTQSHTDVGAVARRRIT